MVDKVEKMEIPSWIMLNNQVVDKDGNLKDLEADKKATREYFINYVNKHTQYFHSLEEKIQFMLDNDYWEKGFLDKYTMEQIKELFKKAYAYKFRFQSLMSASKFYESYALKTNDGKTFLERYEDKMSIVALYHGDGDYEKALRLMENLMLQRFTPSTPTLLNSGRARRGMGVSCFLLSVNDSTEGITKAVEFSSHLSRLGGGVALDLTALRAKGESVKGYEGVAKGVIGVMKMLENTFNYFDQMG